MQGEDSFARKLFWSGQRAHKALSKDCMGPSGEGLVWQQVASSRFQVAKPIWFYQNLGELPVKGDIAPETVRRTQPST